MKKVLYVTRPMVPPWHEGSKNLVWHLASNLTNFEPHLLTMPQDGYPNSTSSIVWHPIYSKQKLTLMEKGRLVRFLYGRLPQINLIHNYFVPSPMTSILLSNAQRRHRLPVVQTVPSVPHQKMSKRQARQLFYGDAVVVYSDHSAELLQSWCVKNVVQVNVGIQFEKYTTAKRDLTLRAKLGCDDEAVLILFSGEYTRLGAIDRLRYIMPQVIQKSKNVHFVMACRLLLPTDEPIKQKLQRDVEKWGMTDRIHFVGEMDDFPTLLKSADLFVYPVSDMTGKIETPLTLIEAMASSLPVMTSKIYPLKKMFPDSLGVLFPPTDNEGFIDKLLDYVHDKAKRVEQGAAGFAFVKPRYSMAQMVSGYEAIYDKLS